MIADTILVIKVMIISLITISFSLLYYMMYIVNAPLWLWIIGVGSATACIWLYKQM